MTRVVGVRRDALEVFMNSHRSHRDHGCKFSAERY